MTYRPDLRTEALALRDQLVAWRRDFHRHPELALQEHRTSGVIADYLRALGYQVRTGVGQTGVVGLLTGARPGPVVMLRCDMDALPVSEESGAEYASQNPGVMHACGHDAHMAIGLGVATLMAGRRDEMAGTFKLLFQPAEESLDGARKTIADGALENPRPDVFLALHVTNELPVGTLDCSPGPVMAASDGFDCVVEGRGGHGAMPSYTVDPIVAAAHIVTALQTVVSRNVNPLDSATVTVGMIHGGDARNIIPPRVTLKGTIRSFTPEVRERVLRRVREVAEGVAAACGAAAQVTFVPGTPAVVNDPQVSEAVCAAAEAVLGAGKAISGYRTMTSEDAAFLMQLVPGCYFHFGTGNAARGIQAPLHNPRFTVDEDALPLGVAVLMQVLAHYL